MCLWRVSASFEVLSGIPLGSILGPIIIFSEREPTFTFAIICYRPTVCRLSVCRL